MGFGMGETDRQVVRALAERVAEIAATTAMERRRQEWRRHNALRGERPMLLVYPEGSWSEILPDGALECREERARSIERDLRMRIITAERFATDNVIDADWVVGMALQFTGWGLEPRYRPSTDARGAWAFDPVLHCRDDLRKLRHPEVHHDERATERAIEEAQALLGDLLTVRRVGIAHISFHLMAVYTRLRGLEETMVDMHEQPAMLHEAMEFLTQGHERLIRRYRELNALSLNNDGTYHSSGGIGYTDELPAPGFDPGRVRPSDLWASAEAQELAQVSPRMHAEFALRYERRLLEPFGLNGYGCCEDLTRKLDDVLELPRLRRVSIAPTADLAACAARIGRRCIVSWKPDPSYLVGAFDAEKVRAYVRSGVRAARGCALEIILKDTHTCEGRPERFDVWARVAREVVEEETAA
ncbi:MAG TPA: hypothetical protein VLH79_09185 [Chthonomonadales bacterium]|nr:hypothetical protein [Chthonomonadales bacterium]